MAWFRMECATQALNVLKCPSISPLILELHIKVILSHMDQMYFSFKCDALAFPTDLDSFIVSGLDVWAHRSVGKYDAETL